jgi:hypothetical protein
VTAAACLCAALAACSTDKLIQPPPIDTPVQVRFTSPSPLPWSNCDIRFGVSMAGPAGTTLAWTQMGYHVDDPPFGDTLDIAFTRWFWRTAGLTAGQSASSLDMAFSAGPTTPVRVMFRFSYTLTSATSPAPESRTDSLAVVCE